MKTTSILKTSGILMMSWTASLILISLSALNAQTDSTKNDDAKAPYRKNIIKINLGAALALKSYNFSYERLLSRKISFVGGYNTMSENKVSELPLMKKVIDQAFDEDDEVKNDLDRIKVANTAYNGEFRFYLGRQPGARGAYFAIYGRYVDTKINYQYQFEGNTKTYDIPIKGNFKGFAGGILMGTQYIISRRVVIDVYFGGHYGKTKGDADGLVDLSSMSAQEKSELKDDLESIATINDKQYLTATVSNDGVHGKVNGPLIGLRAGFSLGIAF
ncbi:DUF3575 domain-containing protein [Pedobacter heparinus]|uniref:DUF3575 domain-containing protein n=1 Tax=Pedobacter heparinus TaxID=984 RepID=UPI00292F424C|nr:DUF3575 domain-containing protein [Pedobacter heparinus]